MLQALRSKLTYANVMATIAVFIALGAGAYAAGIGRDDVKSRHIKDGAVKSQDLRDGEVKSADVGDGEIGSADIGNDQVGSGDIGEGQVGTSEIANGQVGRTDVSAELRFNCPAGTLYFEGACIETAVRVDDDWLAAQSDCLDEGRRLPSPSELANFRLEPGSGVGLDDEWTHFKGVDGATTYSISVANNGVLMLQTITFDKPYRCVARASG
jgi:hypothetical protein